MLLKELLFPLLLCVIDECLLVTHFDAFTSFRAGVLFFLLLLAGIFVLQIKLLLLIVLLAASVLNHVLMYN